MAARSFRFVFSRFPVVLLSVISADLVLLHVCSPLFSFCCSCILALLLSSDLLVAFPHLVFPFFGADIFVSLDVSVSL